QELLNIERMAFAVKGFPYHTLCAALECTYTLNDVDRIVEVQRIVQEHLEWIDAHAPEYEHSTASSAKHGTVSVLANLVTTANARRVLVEAKKKERVHSD